MLIHITILVCSITVPRESCDEHRALDVIRREVPFGIAGMAGQVEIAGDPRPPDPYHYLKITSRR